MKLRQATIHGFRCFDDVEVDLDDLTILLGSNSTGKSSLLKGLQFFFEGGPLSTDDVFAGSRDGQVSVELTFVDLSAGDREAFGPYGAGQQMVLRQSWEDGTLKLTGKALRAPIFDEIRDETGVARRTAYNQLAKTHAELGLPAVGRVADADNEMHVWEMQNADQCERRDEEAGSFFGFGSVGRNPLAQRFKFVFVPGLRDAAEEAIERKGSILTRLLAAITEQRSAADEKLRALLEKTRKEYADVVADAHAPTLNGLARNLQDHMRRYVPSAQVQLEAVEAQFSIAAPSIVLRGGEEQHVTDLGRQGHGFQRTFVIAALEYLAEGSATEAGENAAADRPTLFLAIEEPELYQHPPRARHFANTLRSLAGAGVVQVAYATHSPYFVDAADFAAVRVCRKRASDDPVRPSTGTVVRAEPDKVAARIPANYRKALQSYLARTLSPRFREAFFARAVLLVEGETDAAVFEPDRPHGRHRVALTRRRLRRRYQVRPASRTRNPAMPRHPDVHGVRRRRTPLRRDPVPIVRAGRR
jgi:putative ATP-dependent endonuclease of OLD family